MTTLSLASLVIEREPLQWDQVPTMAWGWVRVVGGLAIFIMLFWLLAYYLYGRATGGGRSWQPIVFVVALGLALFGYLVGGLLWLSEEVPAKSLSFSVAANDNRSDNALLSASGCWTVAGGIALLGVMLPFVADLFRLRGRRIAAIARLSFQEAIRRRFLWVYVVFLLVILFGSWFLPQRPEDQVRTYVQIIFGSLTPLLLITVGLMAASGLPSDIHSQAIHTIVTKPVERFEIVLGRFLGYVGLATVILSVLSVAGLLSLWRGIAPTSATESMRARVPIYGKLELIDRQRESFKGQLIKEWEYRRYVAGGPRSSQRALWTFTDLPVELAELDIVPCEFVFELFRTSRSRTESQGVPCTFIFTSPAWSPNQENAYRLERDQQALTPERLAYLAGKYGIYEETRLVRGEDTQSIHLPGELFRQLMKGKPGLRRLQLEVHCQEAGQYIGVARHDLYLVSAEGWFSANFFKAVLGLWFRLCLIVGIAVACSTYLSGIISWLCALFLYGTGTLQNYLSELAEGTLYGGGPGESLVRLFNRERLFLPLDQSPTAQVAVGMDEVHRWFLKQVLMPILPDVERFDWTEYLAAGFDISPASLALNGLLLLGYLLPWGLLAYYLIKAREIAS